MFNRMVREASASDLSDVDLPKAGKVLAVAVSLSSESDPPPVEKAAKPVALLDRPSGPKPLSGWSG